MPLDLDLTPPSSQSIAKRALICAALADGSTILDGSFYSQDLQVMVNALRQIGLKVNQDSKQGRIEIIGQGGIFPVEEEYIDVENSTLTLHFLTSALAFSRGLYRINGDRRVQQFPLGDLIYALNQLGADVRSANAYDTPPLLIRGVLNRYGISPSSKRYAIHAEMSGGKQRYAAMTGTLSSQYVSGILLASPLAAQNCPVELHVVNQLSCDPYLLMTLEVMKEFGVTVPVQTGGEKNPLFSKGTTYVIPQGVRYRPHTYRVESDASLANYAFAAAAIADGRVTVKNLTNTSIQKEIEFIYCLQRMGCRISFADNSVTVEKPERSLLRGISVDMFDMEDSIQTFAICALFAASPSRVTNIGHLRRREPERLPKLLIELRRFGANITEFEDGFLIVPRKYLNPSTIDAEGDARLAMSLGLIGLKVNGVRIDSADCVRRAWPTFFNDIGLDY
ncbi:MAG: 3-phosphoshikimate 1-carboxyvinyltransferase [Planctomycetaceae bacterium]|jgi:3-phosphoshikimate 1-carboxyvinyltransferase|nr:3-phosphoshikimate 1-carboxyvinyltransferase [Planctomycetaceae bacterium]